MEYKGIYVKDGYHEETQQIVDKYLEGIDQRFKDNPMFIRLVSDELRNLIVTNSVSKLPPHLNINISDDGKSFTIEGGIRPDPDNMNPILADNKNYRSSTFSIDENNIVEVTRYSGTFYRTKDYVNNNPDFLVGSMKVNNVPTVISVYHNHRYVNKDGIEIEHSTYSDAYPSSCDYNSDNELVAQTFIHAPQDWKFNVMPSPARFQYRPFVVKAYRYNNLLGLVNVLYTGRDGKINWEEYAASTEYPELMGTNPSPIFKMENGKQSVDPYYTDVYPNMSKEDIEKEVMKGFYMGILGSKTRLVNPEIYENLVNSVKNSINNQYGIDADSETIHERK